MNLLTRGCRSEQDGDGVNILCNAPGFWRSNGPALIPHPWGFKEGDIKDRGEDIERVQPLQMIYWTDDGTPQTVTPTVSGDGSFSLSKTEAILSHPGAPTARDGSDRFLPEAVTAQWDMFFLYPKGCKIRQAIDCDLWVSGTDDPRADCIQWEWKLVPELSGEFPAFNPDQLSYLESGYSANARISGAVTHGKSYLAGTTDLSLYKNYTAYKTRKNGIWGNVTETRDSKLVPADNEQMLINWYASRVHFSMSLKSTEPRSMRLRWRRVDGVRK